MQFDPLFQNYPSNRYLITAKNGMVATGSNLASAAGVEILRKGGNAVDAAVATAAALTVVEPTANGIGSDAFALVWLKDKLYGLNGSGFSPAAVDVEEIKAKSEDGKMPKFGWTPVTVPGAPKAWAALVKRFGKLSLAEDLAPAIRYAEEGYPLSPVLSKMFENATNKFAKLFEGQSEYDEWFKTFTKEGRKAYGFGEIIKLSNHGKTLRLIGESDADAFYKGEIAQKIDEQSRRDGGYIRKEDLEAFDVSWVEPISVNYRGYDVYEIPPNGQGIVALMALNILKEGKFTHREDVNTFHQQFEAMKMAFADGMHYVTDPNYMGLDYHDLIKAEYGKMRFAEIGEMRQAIEKMFNLVIKAYENDDLTAMTDIDATEQSVDDLKALMRNKHIERLNKGSCSAEVGVIFLTYASNAERVADHLLNVAQAIQSYAPGAAAAQKA